MQGPGQSSGVWSVTGFSQAMQLSIMLYTTSGQHQHVFSVFFFMNNIRVFAIAIPSYSLILDLG